MNLDVKLFNKISAYQIQQCIKRITNHYQVELITGMQTWSNITPQKNQCNSLLSTDYTKSYDLIN